MKLVQLVFGALTFGLARASPSESSNVSKDEITLLFYNDLDAYTASAHPSALLLAPRTYANAVSGCSVLYEKPLPINQTFFENDLRYALQYQVYQGHYPRGQHFYVAAEGKSCRVVDTSGNVSQESCNKKLPVLCSQSAGYAAQPMPDNQVTVKSGEYTVTGYRDSRSFRFLGIPYVDRPERFTYSQPYTGPKDINATQYGPPCVQPGSPNSSEDCLFVNIYTPFIPSKSSPKKNLKPVMFYIHGGSFYSGAPSDPTFDGAGLASRGDVIVVVPSYRLSTLGFFSLLDGSTNGNFGIADIIAALDWTRENVAAFGGDPDHITIFGQSAGGATVHALLGSPKVQGKYKAAIQMSHIGGLGMSKAYEQYYSLEEAQKAVTNPVLEATGCNFTTSGEVLSCMRAYDAHKLVELANVSSSLVKDGSYITVSETPLDGSGTVANVHLMLGFMRDDGAAFLTYPTNADLSSYLTTYSLPPSLPSDLFPEPHTDNPLQDIFNLTVHATTDAQVRCVTQASVYAGVKHNLFKSVWFYEFNRSYQTPNFNPNPPQCEAKPDDDHPYGNPNHDYFRCHSGDLYYVWGTLPTSLPYRDAYDLPFSQYTMDHWSAFGRTFNPNPDPAYLTARGYDVVKERLAKEDEWLPATDEHLGVKVLQWGGYMRGFIEEDQCDFLGLPVEYFE